MTHEGVLWLPSAYYGMWVVANIHTSHIKYAYTYNTYNMHIHTTHTTYIYTHNTHNTYV